jgi:hypothetical protein
MKISLRSFPIVVLIATISLTICSIGITENLLPGGRESAEFRCRFMLRTLGDAEHAYIRYSKSGNFGGWHDLVHAGFIPGGYSRSNYIENYSISYFQVGRSTHLGKKSAYDSTFTIIAMPLDQTYGLKTFAIDDTEKVYYAVRGIDPKDFKLNTISLKSSRQWQPAGRKFIDPKKWENDCVSTLRALGSCQLAYADSRIEKNYGTWDSLTKTGYVDPVYTRSNIIENYSIAVFSVGLRSGHGSFTDSTFTIVAIPLSQKHGLRTFGLGDDQTPVVFIGGSHDFETYFSRGLSMIDLGNLELWEPLR